MREVRLGKSGKIGTLILVNSMCGVLGGDALYYEWFSFVLIDVQLCDYVLANIRREGCGGPLKEDAIWAINEYEIMWFGGLGEIGEY